MLSLKLCLDLLRLFFFFWGRQQPKFTRIVSFGPVSMSLPQTISSSGVNPIPFPKSADTPITERLFVLLFWRYLFLASLFIVLLLRRPGWKKSLLVFSSFNLSPSSFHVFLSFAVSFSPMILLGFDGFGCLLVLKMAHDGIAFFWSPLLFWDYCGHFCRVNYFHGISPTRVVWPRG